MRLLLITYLFACLPFFAIAAELQHAPERITERKPHMTDATPDAKQKRREEILQIFKDHPDKISPAIQAKILDEQVVLGMTPYDAYLAAGAFFFKVIHDPTKWQKNADPYKVMWAQSITPDDSQIWMTFQSDTQYPEEGKQSFQVFFKRGKAVEIEKQEGSK